MPTVIFDAAFFSLTASLSRISSAARTVKVTAVISSGLTPFSTRRAIRSTNVNVFPVPGPAITAVAETNPDLAAKLRSAKATTAEARDAIHDARTARHAAIKGIHDARAAARREEKHDE